MKNGLFFTRHLDFGEVLTKQVDPPFKPDPVAINALSKEDILGDDESVHSNQDFIFSVRHSRNFCIVLGRDEEHDSEMTAEEQIEWSDWPYVNHTACQFRLSRREFDHFNSVVCLLYLLVLTPWLSTVLVAVQEEIVEYLQWREENGYSDIDDSPKPDAKTSRSCSLL